MQPVPATPRIQTAENSVAVRMQKRLGPDFLPSRQLLRGLEEACRQCERAHELGAPEDVLDSIANYIEEQLPFYVQVRKSKPAKLRAIEFHTAIRKEIERQSGISV